MSQRPLNGTGSDAVILVNATLGAEVVALPRGFAVGRRFTVRRIDGSVSAVTVAAASTDSIDGVLADTKTIPANSEAAFVPLEAGQWESFGLSSGGDGAVDSVVGQTGAVTGAQILADGSVASALTAKADAAATTSALAGKAAVDFGNVTAATGRAALELGGAAVLSVGTGAGTVAAGNDARLSDTRTPTDGTVSLAKLSFDVSTQAELDAVAALKADKTTTVAAGTGLTGGGDLSSNRTLTVAYGSTSTTATVGNDSRVVNAVQSTTITAIVKLTQAAYDAIGSPDAATLYVVVG